MCQFFVARGHAAKLLEPIQEAFHQIAIFIDMSIIRSVCGAVAARRDHRLRAYGLNVRDQRICVISLVADDGLGVQALNQGLGLRHVSHFAARQYPAQRVAPRIDREMDLGTQPAPRAPECLRAVFFWAPAACWWARTTVLSMSKASKSASSLIAAMIRCHTPFLPQREKRVYVACQFPHAGSKSRHGLPVRAIHSTASINRRLSFAVTPQSVALPGSKSLIRSHWSSRSSVRGIASGSS